MTNCKAEVIIKCCVILDFHFAFMHAVEMQFRTSRNLCDKLMNISSAIIFKSLDNFAMERFA